MDSFELTLVRILRVLVEVALFTLLGQGLLYVLAGKSREGNVIYRLFKIITNPVTNAVRALTPRIILDRHISLVSFFLLFWLWLMLAVAKRYLA